MSHLIRQDRSDIKKNNLRLCLETILKHEPVSRASIGKITNISKPTVSSLVDDLVTKQLVLESEVPPENKPKDGPGRKPLWLRFNSRLCYYLAFEIGHTHYSVVLSDLKGRFIQEERGKFARNTSNFKKIIAGCIQLILENQGISIDRIYKAVSVSAGVYKNPDSGVEYWKDPSYSDGSKPFFEEYPSLDVETTHSTKMALLGEETAGDAKNRSNVLYLDFGYGGVGAALLIDGKIHTGLKNAAGEIGYSYSSLEEFRDYTVESDKRGELENKICGEALERRAARVIPSNPSSLLYRICNGNADVVDGQMVFEAAAEGDPLAYSILREAFGYLNMALSNTINLLAPEMVILGGGYSSAGEILREIVAQDIHRKILVPPKIVVSSLKDKAELIGGIRYLIDSTDLVRELF